MLEGRLVCAAGVCAVHRGCCNQGRASRAPLSPTAPRGRCTCRLTMVKLQLILLAGLLLCFIGGSGACKWSTVGSAGFSAFQAYPLSLKLHPTTGAPYLAYQEQGDSTTKVTFKVMTFNGKAWSPLGSYMLNDPTRSPLGSKGFSGFASSSSLALHPTTGAPFVAYVDAFNSDQATVMTFNGKAWSRVGKAGFTAEWTSYISLALHPTTGAPFVAFQDDSGKATVMTFSGKAWTLVGRAGFSAGDAKYTSLALHPTTGAP